MKKLYYSMGEVSKLTNLPPHVLRNWEKTAAERTPKKNRPGNRAYTDEDLALIFKIKQLVEDQKFTSEGVKRVLKESEQLAPKQPQSAMTPEMRKDLTEVKIFMEQMLQKL
ncbi:MAG: MerR family transcriptional regulator [Bacteroidota bacterium]